MKEKILVVEDDPSILTGLIDLLSSEEYEVISTTDGQRAIEKYKAYRPHLILLDIMIPEKNGYDVCKEIRKTDNHTPIIMLTAKGQEIDKVVGLEIGADDYIVKPFSVNELLARVKAVLRRSNSPKNNNKKVNDSVIKFGDIEINPKTLKGKKNNDEFDVTQREVQILHLFLRHPGQVLDRFTMLEEVWGIKYGGTTRTLDQHIAKLRQKIEDDPTNPKYILTVHGSGYRFFIS